MKALIQKHLVTLHFVYTRLLTVCLVTGTFLPFIHLASARHAHHFAFNEGEFYDVIPKNKHVEQDASLTTISVENYLGRILTGSASIADVTDSQVDFRYCLSANGLLVNQTNIRLEQLAPITCGPCEFLHHARDDHFKSGSILQFAPKQSPPVSS
ncbi:MAG: hypothetical protein JXR76_02480 [Deltaproteobacteria bacterium]|nr:hypothetical protein [Deltaproteobacteria bacterium]